MEAWAAWVNKLRKTMETTDPRGIGCYGNTQTTWHSWCKGNRGMSFLHNVYVRLRLASNDQNWKYSFTTFNPTRNQMKLVCAEHWRSIDSLHLSTETGSCLKHAELIKEPQKWPKELRNKYVSQPFYNETQIHCLQETVYQLSLFCIQFWLHFTEISFFYVCLGINYVEVLSWKKIQKYMFHLHCPTLPTHLLSAYT